MQNTQMMAMRKGGGRLNCEIAYQAIARIARTKMAVINRLIMAFLRLERNA